MTYPQQVPNILTSSGTWSERPLRVFLCIINHHSCNGISISLKVKCIDLPLKELRLLSQERCTTHTHILTHPFWNS